jgi:chemotaxis methyl-accepting protein methylase
MDGYVKFIQQTPDEVEALFRDMLIGVSNSFCDREAFKALEEQIVPKLFAGRPADATIRVWVPGCPTGEEAYSLVILEPATEPVLPGCDRATRRGAAGYRRKPDFDIRKGRR